MTKTETDEKTYWYRYDGEAYSTIVDAEAELYGTNRYIVLRKYEVLKTTPRGVWLKERLWDDKDKVWVKDTRDGPGKRFAYATKEEAMESFIARKARLIQILEGRLREAELYKNNAEYMLYKGLYRFDDRESVFSHRRKLMPEPIGVAHEPSETSD